MSTFLAVRALHEERVPKKTIARRLGINVRTVRAHIRLISRGASEPRRAAVSKKLDQHLPTIEAKVSQGLSAVQIFQDLSEDPLFDACYETVKRAVRKLRVDEPEVYSRMSFAPGEEAQIDFGEIDMLDVGGEQRRVWLFAMTLCYSRYSYYELVLDQTVPTFLGAIRRGFEHFGGAPARLKPDNLKSAVLINALGERHYQEDFFRFCQHYGCVPDAARPATPTDKGRVERDIGYVKGSCFAGRQIKRFDEAVAWLARWHGEVASLRVHGTTRRRPIDLFNEVERAALKPLPNEPYEIAVFTHNKVRKDCHVQVLANFYSVPYTLVGQTVSVRRTEQRIDVFAGGERVASHVRAIGRGKSVTDPAHYPPTKRRATQEIHRERVELVRAAGPHTQGYVGRLHDGRWVFGDQIARLAKLVERFGAPAVEKACARALHFGALDGAACIEKILVRGLQELELEPHGVRAGAGRDFGRELREYDLALSRCKEAS